MQTSFACETWGKPRSKSEARVAIFHLSVKTISRSLKGGKRTATAAAAYRSGTAIPDERSGEVFDYTRKRGVASAELLLPVGAPEWAGNRAVLWNAVEQAETRINSTVAREFIVALPAELEAKVRHELALSFARELVGRYGFVADVAIHQPSTQGDDRNHHAHILCSTRRLEAEGFAAKTRELDDRKQGIAAVKELRELWANKVNAELWRHRVADRVDHRSYRARGIDLLPTIHLGVEASGMERSGEPSNRAAHNAEIRAVNAELRQVAAEHKELTDAIYKLLDEAEREHAKAERAARLEAEWAAISERANRRKAEATKAPTPASVAEAPPPPTLSDDQRLANFWTEHPEMKGEDGKTNMKPGYDKARQELAVLRSAPPQTAWEIFYADEQDDMRNALLAAEKLQAEAEKRLSAEQKALTEHDGQGMFKRLIGGARRKALEAHVAKLTQDKAQADQIAEALRRHYEEELKPKYERLAAKATEATAMKINEREALMTEIDWVAKTRRERRKAEQVRNPIQVPERLRTRGGPER